MNDDGQWIVLMGFLISIALLFLMVIISQATLVGQTTAEGVLEFPKHEIRDLRGEVFRSAELDEGAWDLIREDIRRISLEKNHAIVDLSRSPIMVGVQPAMMVTIRFNNGVCEYEETFLV